jgi:hypothetical protein
MLWSLRMRNDSPSLAPTVPAYNGATTHIVLDDFGLNLGRAYVETDEAQADQKTIVENMIAGQYSNPVRVVAFNTEEGWSRDVSEDIARAVADKLEAEGRTIKDDGVRCFVERQLES